MSSSLVITDDRGSGGAPLCPSSRFEEHPPFSCHLGRRTSNPTNHEHVSPDNLMSYVLECSRDTQSFLTMIGYLYFCIYKFSPWGC